MGRQDRANTPPAEAQGKQTDNANTPVGGASASHTEGSNKTADLTEAAQQREENLAAADNAGEGTAEEDRNKDNRARSGREEPTPEQTALTTRERREKVIEDAPEGKITDARTLAFALEHARAQLDLIETAPTPAELMRGVLTQVQQAANGSLLTDEDYQNMEDNLKRAGFKIITEPARRRVPEDQRHVPDRPEGGADAERARERENKGGQPY